MAAKIEPTERQSAGAAAGSDEQLDQQLRAILENLQQVTKEDEPVERDDLRPSITPYLDHEASERKAKIPKPPAQPSVARAQAHAGAAVIASADSTAGVTDTNTTAAISKSHSRAVLPIMPTECSVRRARAAIAHQHRRRNAGGASAAGAWRMNPRGRQSGSAPFNSGFFDRSQKIALSACGKTRGCC